MGLFSRKGGKQEADIKFVGVHLPLRINTYLTAYSLATSTPKSRIVEQLLDAWQTKESKTKFPMSKIITTLQEILIKRYRIEHVKNQRTFVVFKKKAELELQKKGIDEHTIIQILKGIPYEKS